MQTERDVKLIDLGDASVQTKTPIGPVNDGVPMAAPIGF